MKWRDEIASLWSDFNEWRVKGWKLRVVLLLLCMAFPLYECLTGDLIIKRLVALANEATLNECLPKAASAQTRYYQIRDAKALRTAIGRHFDLDSDGVLDGNECAIIQLNGIKPEELTKSSTRENASYVQVETLAWFAKRYNIVSRSYSVEERRREAFYAGVASVERERAAALQDLQATMDNGERADYRKLETWRRGVDEFLWNANYFLHSLRPVDAVTFWLLLCFLAGAYAAQESLRVLRFVVAGAVLCLAGFGLEPEFSFRGWLSCPAGPALNGDRFLFAGFALLTLAAALKGAKLKLKLPTFDFLLASVLAAAVYIAFEIPLARFTSSCFFVIGDEPKPVELLLLAGQALACLAVARLAVRRGTPED